MSARKNELQLAAAADSAIILAPSTYGPEYRYTKLLATRSQVPANLAPTSGEVLTYQLTPEASKLRDVATPSFQFLGPSNESDHQRDYAAEALEALSHTVCEEARTLTQALATLLDDGDEVLLPTPYWTTYPEPIRLAGGVPVVLPTTEATGFRVTVDQLEAARTDRTKALIFVSPSNPTGAVYSRDEIAAIGRWALEHGVLVITDEIYEHLVYGDAEFHSILAVVPELADQTIILNGVAKTYAMTGWRVGWLIGPSDVVKAVARELDA